MGIRSLRAREAVLKLWHAFSPPWMVVERHILRPHSRPSDSEGLEWDSSKNSHLRYQSGTNEGCGWRNTGLSYSYQCHFTVVTYLETTGILSALTSGTNTCTSISLHTGDQESGEDETSRAAQAQSPPTTSPPPLPTPPKKLESKVLVLS